MDRTPPPPSPFASDDDWHRWRRARRMTLPPWHADRDYVTTHALHQLPHVTRQLGTGDALSMIQRPTWWWSGSALPQSVLERHGLVPIEDEHLLVLALEPGSYDLLFIDRATGEWEVPSLERRGRDLVSLAAWRWGLNETKAAWRLARACGLRKPTA